MVEREGEGRLSELDWNHYCNLGELDISMVEREGCGPPKVNFLAF